MTYTDSFHASRNRAISKCRQFGQDCAAEREAERRTNETVTLFLRTPAGQAWRSTPEGAAWISDRLERFPGLGW